MPRGCTLSQVTQEVKLECFSTRLPTGRSLMILGLLIFKEKIAELEPRIQTLESESLYLGHVPLRCFSEITRSTPNQDPRSMELAKI